MQPCFAAHGVVLPGDFTEPGRFHFDPSKQDQIATWVEFLYVRYRDYESWVQRMEQLRPHYDTLWQRVVASNILRPGDTEELMYTRFWTQYNDQWRTDNFTAEKALGEALPLRHQVTGLASLAQVEKEIKMCRRAMFVDEKVREMNHRFGSDTLEYRVARSKVEYHQDLLRWAEQEFPKVQLAVNPSRAPFRFAEPPAPSLPCFDPGTLRQPWTRTPPVASAAAAAATFQRFPHLLFELRWRVWLACLPPSPAAYFFDVVNPLTSPYSFSFVDVRLQPSERHQSAYLHVLPLLAACSESRAAVFGHYRRTGGRLCPGPASIDWIPLDDLVILCLPPRKVRHYPAASSITLADRSAIGLAVPEVYVRGDHALQANHIVALLKTLGLDPKEMLKVYLVAPQTVPTYQLPTNLDSWPMDDCMLVSQPKVQYYGIYAPRRRAESIR